MPRYYCDYCETYLTHDSPSVRKQHNTGYKHKANVRTYYQQYEAQLNQSLIDQKVKEHLGQAAAYRPVGASFNPLRPGLPVLPTPVLPFPGNTQLPASLPLAPGMRPPVLLRPVPGYMSAPAMPPVMVPPGAPSLPGQVNGTPGPVTMNAPSMVPGSTGTASSSGAPSMFTPAIYQANAAAPTAGSIDNSITNSQAPEASH
ncbi:unnamed protein product [Ilex paraguariensis]